MQYKNLTLDGLGCRIDLRLGFSSIILGAVHCHISIFLVTRLVGGFGSLSRGHYNSHLLVTIPVLTGVD